MSATFPDRGARAKRLAHLAVAVVLALLGGLLCIGPASGDTASQLAQARARLRHLGGEIKTEEAQVASMRVRLVAVDRRISAGQARERTLNASLDLTRSQLEEARAQFQATRAKLDTMARSEYIVGPGSGLDVILGATSFSDLFDRVQFVSDLGQQEADLGTQIQALASLLRSHAQRLGSLVAQQKRLLGQLTQEQQTRAAAVGEQEAALSQLDSTRSQIVQLIGRLQRQLRREELASIGRIFQGGAHVSYGAWAGLFLRTMGAPGCHDNMVAAVAWQVAEFTQANWNPLATTYPMPGSTLYNYAGVRNYTSLGQGLSATRLTIQQGSHGYGAIEAGLSACANPMTTARAINASDWCGGCAAGGYVVDMVPKVEANYSTYAAL